MLEEGNLPHPRCPRCDLQVPWKALNGRHLGTAKCKKGAERKRRRLAETETREKSERVLHADRKPMEAVSEFRYLGRLLTATDDDWPAVAGNIRKARVIWGRLARVLGREGEDPKVSRSFYTAVTIPAWASGSKRNTSVFHMLGVTSSGPQFRKPENFRKGRLDFQAHVQ